jgi:hypothetical protein
VLKCTIDIAGGQSLRGINYHNTGAQEVSTTETTVEANTSSISAVARGSSKAECFGLTLNTTLTSHFTTGNAIATERKTKESGAAMIGIWWE